MKLFDVYNRVLIVNKNYKQLDVVDRTLLYSTQLFVGDQRCGGDNRLTVFSTEIKLHFSD